jgi:nicotinamide mononucleotide transporter
MIEIIAVLTTLFCVVLTMKSSIWCWPVGIISTIAYFVVFYQQHLYAEAILQIIFTVQGLYGWYYWGKNKAKKPFFIDEKRFIYDMILLCVSVVFLSHILAIKTDNPQPAYDAVTSMLSLYGTWYLAKKNMYGWIMFLIADFFFIVMFVQEKMFWSAGLYVILLILAFNGLIKWTRNSSSV